jgi:hypothetical protein
MSKHDTKTLTVAFYGGGWPTNIGNAFIDLGAMAILKAAIPEARVFLFSALPRWLFRQLFQPEPEAPDRSIVSRVQRRLFGASARPGSEELATLANANMDMALNVGGLADCDLAVFAGMAMCQELIDVNGPLMLELARRGVRILLLGTGGSLYTGQEAAAYGQFLDELRPLGFISRDRPSYEMFAGHVQNAYAGIDCGFFVPDAFSVPRLACRPYIAISFDSVAEPSINSNGFAVLRAHHTCWGHIPRDWAFPNTLISDLPQDYLSLYANAEEVHSDRVHACVAALAYGRKARLYSPTPRGALFEAVNAATIRQELVRLDIDELTARKHAQVKMLRCWLTETFGLA